MKLSKSYKTFLVVNATVLILLSAVLIYPYLNQLAIALNDGNDSALGGITIFPRKFTMINFTTILSDQSVGKATLVSVLRTVLNVVIHLFVTFSAAYALTRRNLKGRSVINKVFMLTMYLNAGTIPTYILFRYLGLINNFWVYVLPYSFSFYNMIIMRSFIQELPIALEESALLDGANEFTILMKIIVPLSKPVLATIALWVAVGQWNDYSSTLMYVTDKNLFSLQYLMLRIIKQGEALKQIGLDQAMGADTSAATAQTTSESIKAAMLIVSTVPILCIYPFLQKYFVKGVTLGAVKG